MATKQLNVELGAQYFDMLVKEAQIISWYDGGTYGAVFVILFMHNVSDVGSISNPINLI